MDYLVVRLGADSKLAIQQIDSPGISLPLIISVECKQVPATVAQGDIAFIWLGTDNSKGTKTAWVQGIRALGSVVSITGQPGYKFSKTIQISVAVVLPQSITKKEIADQVRVPYRFLSDLPVVGVNNYSSQVVQRIEETEPSQSLPGLLTVIELLRPGFRKSAESAYPSLISYFSAFAASPPRVGDWGIDLSSMGDYCGLVGMNEPALRALSALRAGMHVIFTGPPGTGKTKLAECVCRKAGFPSLTVPATDQWTTFETIGGYFPVPASDVSLDTDGERTFVDRLDFLPGAVVDGISRGHCVIIDEINRADIDKAFGELFTLLSGNSVTLPFRRRSQSGFRRIRLQIEEAPVEADIDDIPVPIWWRIIGAMNDADKASLKRMSIAFIRRFAFIPVGLPSPDIYSALLAERSSNLRDASGSSSETFDSVYSTVNDLFSDPSKGFGSIGMPFGPAIPLSMLVHASMELKVTPSRSSDAILASVMELYVAPQFQGRADKHDSCQQLMSKILSAQATTSFSRTLAVWTGFEG